MAVEDEGGARRAVELGVEAGALGGEERLALAALEGEGEEDALRREEEAGGEGDGEGGAEEGRRPAGRPDDRGGAGRERRGDRLDGRLLRRHDDGLALRSSATGAAAGGGGATGCGAIDIGGRAGSGGTGTSVGRGGGGGESGGADGGACGRRPSSSRSSTERMRRSWTRIGAKPSS